MSVKYVFNPFTATFDAIDAFTGALSVDTFVVTVPATHDFTLTLSPVLDSEFIILNGVTLNRGATEDYTISGNTLTISASYELRVGDKLVAKYRN